MMLSEEGLNPTRHYKAVQSGELGFGFALAVAGSSKSSGAEVSAGSPCGDATCP